MSDAVDGDAGDGDAGDGDGDAGATGAGRPRTRFGLMRDPAIGPLVVGRMLSTLAVWFTNIAAAILVYDLTRSASAVALVTTAQFAPQLLLVVPTGVRADRGDRARQMLIGTLVTTSGSALMVTWALTFGFSSPSDGAVVVTAAALTGIGFAIGGPASQSLMPALVRPAELADALALSTLPIIVARAAGPAVGALLFVGVGATATFGASLALHLGYVAILIAIRRRLAVERPAADGDPRARAALRYLVETPRAALSLLGLGVIGLGVDPVVTLGPPLADLLGDAGALVGALATAFGLGSAVGYAALSRVRVASGLDALGALGLRMMAVGIGLTAVAPSLDGLAVPLAIPLAVLGFGVAGVGMPLALNAFTTIVQADLPDELRGRVMAVWSMAFIGSRPLAATLDGAVADAAGVQVALVVAAALILVGAAAAGPRRLAAMTAAG
jgi:MFS family permease